MKKYLSPFLTFVLLATVVVVLLPNQASAAPAAQLLTTDNSFQAKKTSIVDFSSSSSAILSDQYAADTGVTFDNSVSLGWATYQANGFANHLSSVVRMPGAPTGITGTKVNLETRTKKVGMYVQAGSPFSYSDVRPAKDISVRAYAEDGSLLFSELTDTCLGQASFCTPQFIGVEYVGKSISSLEIVINEAYNWSIDDLKWER